MTHQLLVVCSIVSLLLFPHVASAEDSRREVSPQPRIEPSRSGPGPRETDREPGFRTIDGSGNNLDDPEMNATGTHLGRSAPPQYAADASALAGDARISAREVSNLVNAQEGSMPNSLDTTDYLWQWGQFLDHDVDLTEGVDLPESADIPVPIADPSFDPSGLGGMVIPFNRSIYDPATGDTPGNPRQQLNEITGWIDASNVYGSDPERADALRTLDGSGELPTREADAPVQDHPAQHGDRSRDPARRLPRPGGPVGAGATRPATRRQLDARTLPIAGALPDRVTIPTPGGRQCA